MTWKKQAYENRVRQQENLAERRAYIAQCEEGAPDDYRDHYNWRMSQKRFQDMEKDPEKAIRLEAWHCKYCRYMGGSAVLDMMSRYACQRCGKEDIHGDSGVPLLCRTCAQEEKACVACGSPVEEM